MTRKSSSQSLVALMLAIALSASSGCDPVSCGCCAVAAPVAVEVGGAIVGAVVAAVIVDAIDENRAKEKEAEELQSPGVDPSSDEMTGSGFEVP